MGNKEKNTALQKFLNQENPLGPDKADEIKNDDVAAEIFDGHNSTFNRLMSSGVDVVLGRRGSGKTALLRCYRLAGKLRNIDKYNNGKDADDDYDIIIDISSEYTFYNMQLFVLGDNTIDKPVEIVVAEWAHVLGDLILGEIIKQRPHHCKRPELMSIAAYLDTPQTKMRMDAIKWVWGENKEKQPNFTPCSQDEALEIADKYLSSAGSRVALIIDSMDEYQVGDRVTDRTIGALLRFVRKFNAERDFMRVKVALPYEIFPEIKRASANPLRDIVRVDRIQWQSTELMQMAAHRYRIYLEMYDQYMFELFKDLDFSRRSVVNKFWKKTLGQIKNSEGIEEDTVTFLLRHTQLLPRQFILMLNHVIRESFNKTGGHRIIISEIAHSAVERSAIADEVYSAYKVVFPNAERISREVLGNAKSIFTYEQFEEQWKRVGRPLDYKSNRPITEFTEVVQMMLRMGIIGIVQARTEKYIEASFSYIGSDSLNTGIGGELCVHPIFIKNLGCNSKMDGVTVLPAGVIEKVG